MSASRCTRTAVTLPSASAASSMSWIWPRPWMVACGVLAAALRPAGRRPQLPGHGEGDELLGVHVELRAEAAADRRGDHAQLVLRHAGRRRQHHLEDVRDLRGRPHRVLAAVGLRHDRHAAGLHGRRDQPLLDVALLDGVDGVGEGGVDGGLVGDQLPVVRLVRAERVVDHDPVGQRVLQVDDGLERLVVDDHRADGVGRPVAAVGHDHRDDVAHVARLVDRDRVVLRVLHVVGDRPGAGHRRDPGVLQVGAGEHGLDAGEGQRVRGVDAGDAGVGVRAAHHPQPAGPRDDEVVDEAALAGEERRVLLAHHAGADDGGHVADPAAASTAFTMLW